MRILVIGGTRFIGPFIVRELVRQGHRVTVFHRGQTNAKLPPGVSEILGDYGQLADHRAEFRRLAPEVVFHTNAFAANDARGFVQTFAGLARRSVVLSSIDVYRAYGRLHRTEPGPPDPTPLTEDSPLRDQPSLHGPDRDKIEVERLVLSVPDFPATVLRLPAVYGPGDHRHRFREYLVRMLDERPVILMEDGYAVWRWSHGYVENIAAAAALVAADDRAAGRIYNLGEPEVPTQAERVAALGCAVGWRGQIRAMPRTGLPPHLQADVDWHQPWTVDTGRIHSELGFREPVTFEEALQRTLAWHKSLGDDHGPPAEYAAEDEAWRKFVAG